MTNITTMYLTMISNNKLNFNPVATALNGVTLAALSYDYGQTTGPRGANIGKLYTTDKRLYLEAPVPVNYVPRTNDWT